MRGLLCVIAVGVGLVATEPSSACSRPVPRIPTDARALVADADAAFIGTLVALTATEPRVLSNGQLYIFTYAVEERVKGDLPDRLEVTSVIDGGLCGLAGPIGRRGAFLASRRDDAGEAWGLAEVGVETLRRGILPLPEPNGAGRPAFVAGGHFGSVRSAILDSRGRTLRYGLGRGAVTDLSICPGGKVVAELVRSEQVVLLALRLLPSLTLIREVQIGGSGYGENVVCRSRSGSDVLAAVNMYGTRRAETQLLRITPVGTRILERAPRLALAVRGERAFISLSDGRLLVRNLDTGTRRTPLRTGQLLTGISVSPDRRFLTGFTGERLVIADIVRRRTTAQPWAGFRNETSWVGPRTFTAWSSDGRLELLDQTLRRLRPAWSWPAHTTAVSGADVFGVDRSGALVTERDGFIVRLGQLFSAAVTVLVPLR